MRGFIALLLLALGLSSCEFDHLYYETSKYALVRIEVDWSEANVQPNGVTAYIFDSQGNRYGESVLSSNPNQVDLRLPAGEFTVVLHNNSYSELSNVWMCDDCALRDFCIKSTLSGEELTHTTLGSEEILVNKPSQVIGCTLRGIVVDASDLTYHYDKPDISNYEQEVMQVYKAVAYHIVHRVRVIAHVGGLDYAKGAPVGVMRGMSWGHSYDSELTLWNDVVEEFYVNTKVTRADGKSEIYVDYNSFGMHTFDTVGQKYYLDMRFELLDGRTQEYSMDVTGNIRTDTLDTRKTHIIEVDLGDLPESEGDTTTNEESEFEPSLDEWKEIIVDVPM